MKRKYLALTVLSYMIVSSVAPFMGVETENTKTDVAAQKETTITTSVPTTQDIPLGSGISKIIFDDNLIIDGSITTKQWLQWKVQHNGWIIDDNIPVMSEPSVDSEMIDKKMFNDHISFTYYNEKWCCVQIYHPNVNENGIQIGMKKITGYIDMNYVSEASNACKEYHIPNNQGCKSFMSYKTITDKSSRQYKLQKEFAYTGDYGIRKVNGRFCVAIGTAFDVKTGTYFDLILENGTVIPCIVGDIKAENHTLNDNITTAKNGCVSEFIVDIRKLKKDIKTHGDVSYAESSWNSPVVKIYVYNKNVLD